MEIIHSEIYAFLPALMTFIFCILCISLRKSESSSSPSNLNSSPSDIDYSSQNHYEYEPAAYNNSNNYEVQNYSGGENETYSVAYASTEVR